jgi:anti-sigma factor RsiW
MHRARWGHSIQSFADGELGADRAVVVARHLAACADCSDDLERVRCLKASLAGLADRRPPDIAIARLRAEAARIGTA